MRTIDKIYIDGQFVTPHGQELFDPQCQKRKTLKASWRW